MLNKDNSGMLISSLVLIVSLKAYQRPHKGIFQTNSKLMMKKNKQQTLPDRQDKGSYARDNLARTTSTLLFFLSRFLCPWSCARSYHRSTLTLWNTTIILTHSLNPIEPKHPQSWMTKDPCHFPIYPLDLECREGKNNIWSFRAWTFSMACVIQKIKP